MKKFIVIITIVFITYYIVNMSIQYNNWTKTITIENGQAISPMTWDEYYNK